MNKKIDPEDKLRAQAFERIRQTIGEALNELRSHLIEMGGKDYAQATDFVDNKLFDDAEDTILYGLGMAATYLEEGDYDDDRDQ